jgi:AraC family transcriptional regulator
MDYRIVEKPAFPVVGKALRVGTKDGENLRRIPQFWDECLKDGSHDRLAALAGREGILGDVTLGICTDFAPNMEEFTYMIAAEKPDGATLEGMVEKTVPAASWAVFEAAGPLPEAIQTAWSRIWSEFFPTAPFKHGDGPELELYPRGNPHSADYKMEVWIPVVDK